MTGKELIASQSFQRSDLHAKISSTLSRVRSTEIQEGLARVVSIAGYFEEKKIDSHDDDLIIAVDALTAKTPSITFADRVLCSLEQKILEDRGGLPSRILKMSAGSPIAAVNLGLLFSFLFVTTPGLIFVLAGWIASLRNITAALTRVIQNSLEGNAAHASAPEVLAEIFKVITHQSIVVDLPLPLPVITVFYFGFLGGVISMFTRIAGIGQMRRTDLVTLFCTALFKPIIGGSFGLIVLAIFYLGVAGLIKPEIQPDLNQAPLWVVIGFLCGFSERFATDMITRAEATLLPAKHAKS
jgi:hypothetical protein